MIKSQREVYAIQAFGTYILVVYFRTMVKFCTFLHFNDIKI